MGTEGPECWPSPRESCCLPGVGLMESPLAAAGVVSLNAEVWIRLRFITGHTASTGVQEASGCSVSRCVLFISSAFLLLLTDLHVELQQTFAGMFPFDSPRCKDQAAGYSSLSAAAPGMGAAQKISLQGILLVVFILPVRSYKERGFFFQLKSKLSIWPVAGGLRTLSLFTLKNRFSSDIFVHLNKVS